MIVLITGTSRGMGKDAAEFFLLHNHKVIGIDINPCEISNPNYSGYNKHYTHYICDIRDKDKLPDLGCNIDILINNAGVVNSGHDIETNLLGSMNVTEKYALNNPDIKSVLFNCSASARTGFEWAEYSASKSGLVGYMKHCAWRLAKNQKATCNSISCGGVITEMNTETMADKKCWSEIMKVTPLKRWATPREISEWMYFMTVINKFCAGQDILIDGGETTLNCHFQVPGFDEYMGLKC